MRTVLVLRMQVMELLGIERGLTDGSDTPTAVGSSDGSQRMGGFERITRSTASQPNAQSAMAVSSLTQGPIANTGLDADAFFEDMLKSGSMFSPTAMLASLRTPAHVEASPTNQAVMSQSPDGVDGGETDR